MDMFVVGVTKTKLGISVSSLYFYQCKNRVNMQQQCCASSPCRDLYNHFMTKYSCYSNQTQIRMIDDFENLSGVASFFFLFSFGAPVF